MCSQNKMGPRTSMKQVSKQRRPSEQKNFSSFENHFRKKMGTKSHSKRFQSYSIKRIQNKRVGP